MGRRQRMGSPWNKRRTEDDEHGIDRLGAPPTKPGLGAAELDLLRQAPDYDAEEMATVRLSGGWPAPLAQPGRSLAPAEAAAKPAAPSCLPPNRLAPPEGARLLLRIDAPAGRVQRTTVAQLDYLGSARLTDLEIADCYAGVADRFDVGVVDTPSLDDALARAWLREAAAALMVLQVDPLTVKTLPSALNTLEMVRAFQPSIQILGLLPTMFDPAAEVHGRLLAELLSRRPEAVFTPVVPADPGLMHRANAEECPPVGEAARQAYQCAVDRILRALESAAPGVSQPRPAPAAPRFVQAQPLP